jgi:hypothetical protein
LGWIECPKVVRFATSEVLVWSEGEGNQETVACFSSLWSGLMCHTKYLYSLRKRMASIEIIPYRDVMSMLIHLQVIITTIRTCVDEESRLGVKKNPPSLLGN